MKEWLLVSLLAVGFGIGGCSSMSASYYGSQACSAEPNPKTWIGETVDVPISIYWEDELYKGFDDADGALMVKNYLDGVHLQTIALNTPDGKVKIYTYKDLPQTYVDLVQEGFLIEKEWKIRKKASREAFDNAYDKNTHKYKDGYSKESSPLKELSAVFRETDRKRFLIHKEIEEVKSKLTLDITETIKEAMPTMNYTVTTKVVPLSESAREYIYSDEVKIIDNRKNEVIAYNRRVMQLYSSSLLPDMVGERKFVSEPLCGGKPPKIFDHDVFISIGDMVNARAKHTSTKR